MPRLDDHTAIEVICKLLDGVEWSPTTLDAIAETVRSTGRPVRDISEVAE